MSKEVHRRQFDPVMGSLTVDLGSIFNLARIFSGFWFASSVQCFRPVPILLLPPRRESAEQDADDTGSFISFFESGKASSASWRGKLVYQAALQNFCPSKAGS